MQSSQLLKGTFQTIILKILQEYGRMYGYEITQKVKRLSDDEIIVSEGSLYPILHKMAQEGLLTTERVNIGNRVRRYYTITPSGSAKAIERIEEFERFVSIMKNVLYPSKA